MEWLGELKGAFGAAAAVVIGMVVTALIYQTRQLNAEREAHHRTRDAHAKALEAVNDKSANALTANSISMAQIAELMRRQKP